MKTIWRVSHYLFRYSGLFYLTLGMAVAMTLAGIAVPRVIQWILENIVQEGQTGKIWLAVAIITGLFLAREVFNSLRIRVNNVLEQRVLVDLRTELHRKLLDLPVSFYDSRKSGEIASRVIEDVQDLERGLLDGTEQGLQALLMVAGIAVMLFVMEPSLAWLVTLPLPIVIGLNWWHAKATRRNWRAVREAAGELNSLLVEDIQGNRMIHSFALQERERNRFVELAREMSKRTLRAMFRWSVHGPGTSFVSSLGTVAVVGMGGYLMMTDPDFNYAKLTSFFLYAIMLYEPISRLNGVNHLLATATASGRRVFEILDHEVLIRNPENPKPFPRQDLLEVRFDNVDFSYAERDEVISGLNLVLPAGKTTALVGHTGAGKSTIANLLLRYYDVTAGSVTVQGIDVRNFELSELRSNIGYVAQDPFLFDGSVRDNLILARPHATEEEMIEALKGAHAWEFVQRLPKGLDTMIGEKGIRLSMGEKQRITIARVLLKNPRMVILDEATSSVDTQTERLIQEALNTLMKDRTVLVIAHRLSTVRKAEQIVVLQRGQIIERGNHETLCAAGGHYAALWRYQSDFIPEQV